MSDQPISLSRADRRKFEKAMRRAPRPSRQKPSRADLPLRLIPWNIHGVWAPLDRILAKLETDGTAEYSGGEPVLYDPGTNDWHNSAPQGLAGRPDRAHLPLRATARARRRDHPAGHRRRARLLERPAQARRLAHAARSQSRSGGYVHQDRSGEGGVDGACSMKMAKPTDHDINLALDIARIVEDLEQRYRPALVFGEFCAQTNRRQPKMLALCPNYAIYVIDKQCWRWRCKLPAIKTDFYLYACGAGRQVVEENACTNIIGCIGVENILTNYARIA